MAEFGSCHRNEPSGALHGLMRVRGFTRMMRISSVLKIRFAMK
nr:Threonine--tRNA ligase [Klebsiella pneumoniae]